MSEQIITLSGDIDADYRLLTQKTHEVLGQIKTRDMIKVIQDINKEYNINIGRVTFEFGSEYDDEGGYYTTVSFPSIYIHVEDQEELVDLEDALEDNDILAQMPHLLDIDYWEVKDSISDGLYNHAEYLSETSFEQIIGSKDTGYEYAN